MPGHPTTAYVDEALRTSRAGASRYLLAAVLVPDDRSDEVRLRMRELLLRRQPRLHWRGESAPRRRKLADAAGELRCQAVVVVNHDVDVQKQERARRQCLERLLWDLRRRSIGEVLLETRQPRRDRADPQAVEAFRRAGWLPDGMVVRHQLPLQEPLLWLADVVAGAAGAGERGPLDAILTIVDLPEG